MRKLAFFAFAFSAGIFLAQYGLPLSGQLPLSLAAAILAAAGFRKKGHARLGRLLVWGGLAAALAYNWLYTTVVQSPAELLAGSEQERLTMTLTGYPEPARYGARAAVRLELPGLHGVRAMYYGDEGLLLLRPGNRITGDTALKSAAKLHDENVTTFTSRGIFLLAYGRGEAAEEEGSAASPRWWPLRLGQAMRGLLGALYDEETASFLSALLTGDKSTLPAEDYAALSEAGLLHVLAVSGMHCGFLLALITGVFGYHRKRLTAAVAIPSLAFYALLAGCTPSVVRACVMWSLYLAAPLFRREGDPPTAMAAALLLILLQNPFAAASVSLQLSFSAMAGLLWLTPKLMKALSGGRRHGRAFRFLASSLSASMGVLVFTAPLTAYYFNILVLLAPLSNLLCLTAIVAMFLTGLASLAAGAVWLPLGRCVAVAPAVLFRYVLWAARGVAAIPFHAVYFSNPYLKYWLALAYGLFAAAYVMKGPRRRYAAAGVLSAVTLLSSVRAGQLLYTAGTLDITVLDVGQGACTVASSGGRFALIDCGSGNSWYDAGALAADALRARGCSALDYLCLTHYDTDHVSGVENLMARLRVGTLLVPDSEDDSGLREEVLDLAARCGVETRFVTERETLALGDAAVTVYPPVGEKGDNQTGLAFLVTAGDYDLLVTGDMDAATEEKLLQAYGLPDIEALVVGHHGSKSSTCAALLEALTPETAIISVGDNRYGHPANQTFRRLLAAGADILRTDLQGDIHITVN